MKGGEDRQLEFNQMKVAAKGGPEGEKVVEEAERWKLINACEEVGVETPSSKEIGRIIENGEKHEEPELDYERGWERRKEEKESKLWPNGLPNGGV